MEPVSGMLTGNDVDIVQRDKQDAVPGAENPLPVRNALFPDQEISEHEKTLARSLTSGGLLILVKSVRNLVTTGWIRSTNGRLSATRRAGEVSLLTLYRYADEIVAFPSMVFAYFEWTPTTGWTIALPVAVGRVWKTKVALAPTWTGKIGETENAPRVRVEYGVESLLSGAEIVTPAGEKLGKSQDPWFTTSDYFAQEEIFETKEPEEKSRKTGDPIGWSEEQKLHPRRFTVPDPSHPRRFAMCNFY